ncbi:MAG: sensor domain-containing diguanylate cyclase [Sulfuricella sp.]|nr:sensor domain-containing diguanylate cyclase [Sulfuricella sp.]
MDHDLQIENQYLRRQLQSLLDEARHNEEKMRRFDRLERRLIGAHTPADLVRIILQDYRVVFELDAVGLLLVDPEYEIARMLDAELKDRSKAASLVFLENSTVLEDFYGSAPLPYLGACHTPRHVDLVGTMPVGIASVAMLPLQRQGEVIGSLNLGSFKADRFSSDSATDFLERLAAIVAISLENTLNHERLKQIGLTDPLTGINNRRYFEHRCLEEINFAQRHDLPLSCMFLDLDKFKRINDSLGHQAGDEVLRHIAAKIKGQLRASDVLARYGGEEFVVLLPQANLRHAAEVAERTRASIESELFEPLPGEAVPLTISIGVAQLPAGPEGGDASLRIRDLIAAADAALYQAKEGGRNRVVCAA